MVRLGGNCSIMECRQTGWDGGIEIDRASHDKILELKSENRRHFPGSFRTEAMSVGGID